jgi:hypothetical protein
VTLDDLAAELRRFAAERDWERFHTPRNLARASTATGSAPRRVSSLWSTRDA